MPEMKEKYKALKEYITIRTSERKIIFPKLESVICENNTHSREIANDLNALLKEWFDKQPLSEWVETGSIPTDKA